MPRAVLVYERFDIEQRSLRTTMTMMRAVLIKDGHGPIENLYIGETDKPVPKKGQVLVKVCASSS